MNIFFPQLFQSLTGRLKTESNPQGHRAPYWFQSLTGRLKTAVMRKRREQAMRFCFNPSQVG